MSDAFDRELKHANDTEMLYADEYNYGDNGAESDDDDMQQVERHHGERPARNAKPQQFNLRDLTKNNRNALPTIADDSHYRSDARSPLNLHNRVPGIAEMLDADSEVLRDLSKKPNNHINPAFARQQHYGTSGADYEAAARRRNESEKQRAVRFAEREKAKQERYERSMAQRSEFHKAAAASGAEIQMSVEGHHKAMVARTNQLGTMVEQLRSDVLEAQIEQQKSAKALRKALSAQQTTLDAQLFFLKIAVCFLLSLVALTLVCRYVVPFIREKWFAKPTQSEQTAADVDADASLVVLPPTAAERASTATSAPKRTALATDDSIAIKL